MINPFSFLDKGILINNGIHAEKEDYEWLGWGYEDNIQNEGVTIRPKDSIELVALYIPVEYAEKSTSYISFYVDKTQGIINSVPKKVSDIGSIIKYSVPDEWFGVNKNNGAFYIKSEYSNKKTKLKYLAIPSQFNGTTVASIANDGLKDCTNLVYISLPYTLRQFGTSALANCKKIISHLTIYPRITNIGANAFYGSSIIFDSVDLTGCTSSRSVGTNAFTGTTVKKLVVNNNGVKALNNNNYSIPASSDIYPFYNVKGFETLELKYGTTKMTNVLSASMRSSISSFVATKTLEEISDSAFENCKKLTKITLPYGVKTYANTFKGCNASISYTL